MIFQHTWGAVLAGRKTSTRRRIKPGERSVQDAQGVITAVLSPKGQKKWVVGSTYGVQPSRNAKAIARIRVTALSRARVQDISEAEAASEGAEPPAEGGSSRDGFARLWDRVNNQPGAHWQDNPAVWVVVFALVE